MKKLVTILLLSLLGVFTTNAQQKVDLDKSTMLGVSAQVYPAGLIGTINLEKYLTNNTSLVFRLGGNFINRRDLSPENDNEKGIGFGGSFGYRKHFPLKKNKISVAFHTDLWNVWIDWKNNINSPLQTAGRTYTFVIQPWLEGTYVFELKNANDIGISLGFGREINAITNGNDVGQGWMGSLVFQYQFTLSQ